MNFGNLLTTATETAGCNKHTPNNTSCSVSSGLNASDSKKYLVHGGVLVQPVHLPSGWVM